MSQLAIISDVAGDRIFGRLYNPFGKTYHKKGFVTLLTAKNGRTVQYFEGYRPTSKIRYIEKINPETNRVEQFVFARDVANHLGVDTKWLPFVRRATAVVTIDNHKEMRLLLPMERLRTAVQQIIEKKKNKIAEHTGRKVRVNSVGLIVDKNNLIYDYNSTEQKVFVTGIIEDGGVWELTFEEVCNLEACGIIVTEKARRPILAQMSRLIKREIDGR